MVFEHHRILQLFLRLLVDFNLLVELGVFVLPALNSDFKLQEMGRSGECFQSQLTPSLTDDDLLFYFLLLVPCGLSPDIYAERFVRPLAAWPRPGGRWSAESKI